jgi:hypothetical protein
MNRFHPDPLVVLRLSEEQRSSADQRVGSMSALLLVWVRDLLAEDLVKEGDVGEPKGEMWTCLPR